MPRFVWPGTWRNLETTFVFGYWRCGLTGKILCANRVRRRARLARGHAGILWQHLDFSCLGFGGVCLGTHLAGGTSIGNGAAGHGSVSLNPEQSLKRAKNEPQRHRSTEKTIGK